MNHEGADSSLVTVHVHDEISETLAGHPGREYTSPPQPRAQALALVALLLGHPASEQDEERRAVWSCPIAGGRRTITLGPRASVADQHQLRPRTSR